MDRSPPTVYWLEDYLNGAFVSYSCIIEAGTTTVIWKRTLRSQLATAVPARLVHDLKRLGLLEDTLIVWGGEFGRTPMAQGSGRDHHINAFSIWMAGGGIKGGTTYGSSDELGYNSVDNVVTVHDLHATMLYLFGIDHDRFTESFQGLDIKLTGVEPARVVEDVIA